MGGKVLSLACGGQHTLVIVQGGKVWSFGRNDAGQLGVGDFVTRLTPTSIILPEQQWCDTFNLLTVSESFQDDVCAGSARTHPTPVLPLNQSIARVYAGGVHSLALTVDRNLFAWGMHEHGQCGLGDPAVVGKTFSTPVLVSMLYGMQITSVSAGGGHSVGGHAPFRPSDTLIVKVERRYQRITTMLPISGPITGGTPIYFIGKYLNTFYVCPEVAER